jgi:protein required for attachment to host cells
MTKPLRTQFIVADGAHARWVRRTEGADDFATVRELKAHAHAGGDEHEHAAFARQVADAINADAKAGHDDRLVLIALARTLTAISEGLSPAARAKLHCTLAKDLAKTADHALGDWLRPMELASQAVNLHGKASRR